MHDVVTIWVAILVMRWSSWQRCPGREPGPSQQAAAAEPGAPGRATGGEMHIRSALN